MKKIKRIFIRIPLITFADCYGFFPVPNFPDGITFGSRNLIGITQPIRFFGASVFQSMLHEVKRDYTSDLFLNPHELTKNVVQILGCQIGPFGTAN